jgi:hypothetical protein
VTIAAGADKRFFMPNLCLAATATQAENLEGTILLLKKYRK